jgi:predicted ABC-type ATPase
LAEIDRLARARADFAFESTLSGRTYVRRLEYLKLKSPQLALRRVAARVRQGGHDVPRADVLRRYARGLRNFEMIYRPLADSWAIYENSGEAPQLLEQAP